MALTAERLRSLLDYDPKTGVFRWRRNGRKAGNLQRNGYRYIKIAGRSHMEHRLAWLHVRGQWPSKYLDHINGKRCDNRAVNLREADRRLNAQNQRRAQRHNKIGVLGVYAQGRVYRACIRVEGKTKHLGCYSDASSAHSAYVEAKRKYHGGCVL